MNICVRRYCFCMVNKVYLNYSIGKRTIFCPRCLYEHLGKEILLLHG